MIDLFKPYIGTRLGYLHFDLRRKR